MSIADNLQDERVGEQDPEVKKYWKLCNELQILENTRHKERVNIILFDSNLQNLAKYVNCTPDHKEKIDALTKHTESSLHQLKEKTKITIENINVTHEKIDRLKRNPAVRECIEERDEAEKRKRKDNGDENGRASKKNKKNTYEDDQHNNNSETSGRDSDETEEREEYTQEGQGNEEEPISDDYDDTEKYKHAISGEKDESLLGMYIQVKWMHKWYKGRVLGWDEEKKVYNVMYDDGQEYQEHLTGPSAEKWEPARVTRKYRNKTHKAQDMELDEYHDEAGV